MSFWTRTGALCPPRSLESGSAVVEKHAKKVMKRSNCLTQPKALSFQSYIVSFANSILTPIARLPKRLMNSMLLLEKENSPKVCLRSRRKGKAFKCVKVLFLPFLFNRKKKPCNTIVKTSVWTENLKSGQR